MNKHAEMHVKSAQLHAILELMKKDSDDMLGGAGWALWACVDLADEIKGMAEELYMQNNPERTKGEVCHG